MNDKPKPQAIVQKRLMQPSELAHFKGDRARLLEYTKRRIVEDLANNIAELPGASWTEVEHPAALGTMVTLTVVTNDGNVNYAMANAVEAAYQEGIKDLACVLGIDLDRVYREIERRKAAYMKGFVGGEVVSPYWN